MNKDTSKQNFLLFFLSAFFVVTFITVSMYNTITIDGGPWLIFTLGSFVFMFGKASLDVIQEFYGRKQRKQIVLVAMLIRFIFFGITAVALVIGQASPGAHEFLGDVLRVMLAGIITLYLGQYFLDPALYSLAAKLLKGKSPFIRGVFSNIIGTMIMTPMQVLISFYGARPDDVVMKMIFGKFLIKQPAIIIASAIGAIAIFAIRKSLKMKSLVETKGQDHN